MSVLLSRSALHKSSPEPRTVTVVMEVKKLVAPLCYYSESVFDKGHDDEEAANGGKEAIQDRG